jgi:serine/threonine-protein kinase
VRLSPDGTRLSTDIREQLSNVWIWDLTRDALMRLTDKPGAFQYCLWAPDGQHVVFSAVASAANQLLQMRADGTGQMEPLVDAATLKLTPYPNAITPDGKFVIFRAIASGQLDNLYTVSLTGDHTVKPLLATEHSERNASISPDGKWMAFESDLSGRFEIYVRPFPNVESSQFPISTAGGVKPLWSPAGGEIFYISADNKMMAVPVKTAPGFSAGKPETLFDLSPYFTGGVGVNFDVTRDGKRFAMIKNPANASSKTLPITVVINWVEDLRARFAAK